MALIKCKECGHEVSNKAETCSNCGAPVKKNSANVFRGILVLVSLIIIFTFVFSSNETPDKASKSKITSEPELSDAECIKTLKCWGERQFVAATVRCTHLIEKLAKYSYKWTDGMLSAKFSRYRWKDQDKGVVIYFGDKIQYQNGFGAWQNMKYSCDYDPSTKQVLDVQALAGQL